MDVLLGRSPHLRTLVEAEELLQQGQVALISIVGPPGSGRTRLLDEYGRRLAADGITVARTVAFEASETEPGVVADALEAAARALMIDDAQWVDGTSLAMLRTRMAAADSGMIIVLAHAPITGYRRFAHDGLVEAAGRLGRAWELALEPLRVDDLVSVVSPEVAASVVEASGGLAADVATTLDAWEASGALRREGEMLVATGEPTPPAVTVAERVGQLGGEERRFAELAAVARKPLSLAVVSAALGVESERALEIGERLSARGIVKESVEGFTGEKRLADGLGPVRRASLSGAIGDALASLGAADRDPGLVGTYYLDAGRSEDALPLLARAGLTQSGLGHFAEAYPLVDGALRVLEEGRGEDPLLEGRLRLARASGYRLAGLSDAAMEDLEVAAARLTGVDRVHALGYAAQIADDRQHPQEAERFLAEGLLEAHLAGEQGMLGSLMTLHARTLARLGFARESDVEMEKGLTILASSGTSDQQQRGRYNQAWVAFDRGDARKAEPAFARLVDEAGDTGEVLADRLAWWSRALFMAGRADEALEARRRSIELADLDAGSVFLAQMALAEGGIRFGAWEDALEAADETLALVLQQLPAWQNSSRYLRASALLGLGRLDEAATEAQAAADSCPEGVEGRRWWLRIRTLQLAILSGQGAPWPTDEAFDITDELLQSEWYLAAARLLVTRSKAERDPSLAAQAMALAMQLGVSDVAAEAAEVGGLWSRSEAGAVAASIKAMRTHVPDDWLEDWESLPHVARGLAAPDIGEETYREAVEQLSTQLDDALEAAGLGVEGRLVSPAQRRARGLRRPRRPFRWTPLRAVAAVFGVAILVVGGVLLLSKTPPIAQDPVITLLGPNPQTVQAGDPYVELGATATDNQDGDLTASIVIDRSAVDTSTAGFYPVTYDVTDSEGNPAVQQTRTVNVVDTKVAIEDRELGPPPKDVVAGQWDFGGDLTDQDVLAMNTGAADRTGVRNAEGYYWRYTTGGPIKSSPVVSGESVVFGSEDGSLYGITMYVGDSPTWIEDTGSAGFPTLAFLSSGGGRGAPSTSGMRVYYGGLDGVLYVRDNASKPTGQVFRVPTEGSFDGGIASPPVVLGDTVYFGTDSGILYALGTGEGFPEKWQADLGSPIRAMPAAAGGNLYVGTDAGVLWSIDEQTGAASVCFDTQNTIAAPPVIAGDTIYVAAKSALTLWAFDVGSCSTPKGSIQLDATITSSPAYANGVLYVADGNFVYAFDASSRERLWQYPGTESISPLKGTAAWPVVGDGVLYFTTDEPSLYAVDINTHELLWRYQLDRRVVSRPAIMDGAVIVGDLSGTVVAIGCTNPPDCK